jgi:arylsulfatase
MKTISRRQFLTSTTVGGLATFGLRGRGAEKDKQRERPNILLIIDDQHSSRAMGWTGETQVKTPHLDRLAEESVRFTSAYANSPVCAPTRHTIYTGLYVSEHGVLHNDRPMRDVPTMMTMLNEAGYTTANIGKMHNAPCHHRRDFQYVLHHEFFDTADGISHYVPYRKVEIEKRGLKPDHWWATRPGKKSWLEHPRSIAGTHWLPEDLTPEHWITDECLAFIRDQLQRRSDRPFFLHASYFPPHHPYGPIAKYASLYDPADMKLPPNFSMEKLGRWCTGKARPEAMTEDDVRWMLAHYFGFVSQLDAEVGRLLEGLEELGVADNTVVIFVSDHGDMIAEHGMFWKDVMYEGSVRVPFMVRWPGVSLPHQEATPVMHADLVPTILSAAGIEVPSSFPGRDLRPLLTGEEAWPERSVYSEYFAQPMSQLMIRKGPFKLWGWTPYGKWSEFRYRLFNVENDPWELRDLIGDPEQESTFKELHSELMVTWERQQPHLPEEIPPPMPRSRYEITWPADPWEPVRPA